MNFLEWIGLIAILIVVIYLAAGIWRFLVIRSRENTRMKWKAVLQCILLWPFSFWQM